jgi:asparaginyl-tRNA synthetase
MTFLPVNRLFDVPTDQDVEARGWIYRARSSGAIVFLVLRDSTGIIQVTVKKGNLPDREFEAAHSVTVESSILVKGRLNDDKRAPGGKEMRATGFTVVGLAQTFPITEYQSEELLLDHRHLWNRSREQTAVMKVKAAVMAGAREWLRENGFFEVTPPILTTNACEGGTTLFKLKYFDRDAYLSQSAQM